MTARRARARIVAAAVAAAVAGCAQPAATTATPAAPAVPAAPVARAIGSPAPDAPDALAPAPTGTPIVWPDRVCVTGGDLVFENRCGCNDALVCAVRGAARGTIVVALATDATRMRACDDCFAMVPGRCALPRGLAAGAWTIEIGGHRAFELTIPAADRCWTTRPTP